MTPLLQEPWFPKDLKTIREAIIGLRDLYRDHPERHVAFQQEADVDGKWPTYSNATVRCCAFGALRLMANDDLCLAMDAMGLIGEMLPLVGDERSPNDYNFYGTGDCTDMTRRAAYANNYLGPAAIVAACDAALAKMDAVPS